MAALMRLIRYQPEFQDPLLALHRSAIEGFTLGMSQQDDEGRQIFRGRSSELTILPGQVLMLAI